MAQLTSEQIYRTLLGSEAKEILLTRLNVILDQIPLLQPHIELSRVRLTLSVEAEIVDVNTGDPNGSYFNMEDELTLRATNPSGPSNPATTHYDQAVVDSTTQAPDQIREEHGLPVTEIRRTPIGIQEEQVTRTEGVVFARTATIDRGRVTVKTPDGQVGQTSVDKLKNTGHASDVKFLNKER